MTTPHFPIYLDYSSTNPCDPKVVDAMIPWLREHFGNPASRSHAWGWEAEEAVEKARVQVADLIGADHREIVWTSGATECGPLLQNQRQAPHHGENRAQSRA
jgi:cysteine desulfurase